VGKLLVFVDISHVVIALFSLLQAAQALFGVAKPGVELK